MIQNDESSFFIRLVCYVTIRVIPILCIRLHCPVKPICASIRNDQLKTSKIMFVCRAPVYQHGLTVIPEWMSDYAHYEMWGEITCPVPKFNVPLKFGKCISSHILSSMRLLIHAWLSKSTVVKVVPGILTCSCPTYFAILPHHGLWKFTDNEFTNNLKCMVLMNDGLLPQMMVF